MTTIKIKGISHPVCDVCNGNGHIRVKKYIPCANPHVEGYVDESYTKVCDRCDGKGYL